MSCFIYAYANIFPTSNLFPNEKLTSPKICVAVLHTRAIGRVPLLLDYTLKTYHVVY